MIQHQDAKTRRRRIQVLLLVVALCIMGWQPLEALSAGVYQAEDVAREVPGEAETIEVGNAQGNMALKTPYARFNVSGTYIEIRWQGGAELTAFNAGTTIREFPPDDHLWQRAVVQPNKFRQGTFSFSIRATDAPILIDTIVVQGDTTTRPHSWYVGCVVPLVLAAVRFAFLAMKVENSKKQDAS